VIALARSGPLKGSFPERDEIGKPFASREELLNFAEGGVPMARKQKQQQKNRLKRGKKVEAVKPLLKVNLEPVAITSISISGGS
jgi:hypothetical protein